LLKYDNCGSQDQIGPPEEGYKVMRDALNSTGRPIFFAACEWAVDFPATWMPPVSNTWRTTYDIQNYWECVVSHVDWTNIYADYAGPGHFNDMGK
jgi:alpha-galactosidase